MLAPSFTQRPKTIDELMGPGLMGRLDKLDVLSRKVFSGKMPGERRSKKRGSSVEFDDYREYVPGDDLRRLDWNVFARFDKLIVKLFREEEDLGVQIIVDASPSMDAGEPSKLIAALRLAMGLGYIGLVKQNRVAASIFGVPGRPLVQHLTPLRGRRGVHELGRFLLQNAYPDAEATLGSASSGGGSRDATDASIGILGPFNTALRNVALARRGKGVLILLSDVLVREDFRQGLSYLASGHGFDATCLQILDPMELDPASGVEAGLVGDLRLTDVETGRASEITMSAMLVKKYKERVTRHIEAVRRACAARDIGHLVVPSNSDPSELLLGSLRKRGLLG